MPKQTQAELEAAQSLLSGRVTDPNEAPDTAKDHQGDTTPPATRHAAMHANARQFADAARRALRSEEAITAAHRLQTGRMDRRAIARASMGAQDVMTRRTVSQGIRTSVVVMLDLSGSMSQPVMVAGQEMTRMAAVRGAASVIVPAIERAGAEVSVIGFSTIARNTSGTIALKPWNKRMPTTEAALKPDALGSVEHGGGTPMVAPLKFAERQLRGRQASRRVCIWLCDGQPNSGEIEGLKSKFAERKGIEHVGIGLQCDLSNLFPPGKCVQVDDMSKLAKAFEDLLIDHGGRK